VNAIDAALILQYDVGLLASLDCRQHADASGDGTINAIDAQLILQYDAGLIPSLPPAAGGKGWADRIRARLSFWW
jgi:hypothetical protein